MTPIEFDQMNGTAAKDQPQYLPLPMYRNEQYVISCWHLTFWERVKILFRGNMWLSLLTPPNRLITPSRLSVDSPFTDGTVEARPS